MHAFAHLLDVFDGLAGGGAVKRLLDGTEASDLLTVAGDDDFFAFLGEVEEMGELIFGFEGAYFFHKEPLNYS